MNDLEILEDIVDYKKAVDKLSAISSSLSSEEKLVALTNLTGLKQDILAKVVALEEMQKNDGLISLDESEPAIIEEEKTSILDRLFRRNKVKSIYVKGSITLTANQENVLDDQGGEEVANNTANGLQYLRTSWRVVIVKDTQSNSTDPNITWDQVFSSGAVKTNEEVGGINSELNIGNMGRFIILKDMRCELSAERPQATVLD